MNKEMFLIYLKERGRSVRWLLEQLKDTEASMSYSTIYKKLRGESEFTLSEIKQLSNILNFSDQEIMSVFFNFRVS
ncbi:hypothetical protein ACFC84_03315 [Enterococcus casseliflavus]|uniref:hypothetical protein n=1 Tax=Enterococcus casseliflavus TaxID=37734 RepID=UPI0039A5000F